jgi:hypothetical protein
MYDCDLYNCDFVWGIGCAFLAWDLAWVSYMPWDMEF